MEIKKWILEHGSTLLTGLGIVGVAGTAACASYDGCKARDALVKARVEKATENGFDANDATLEEMLEIARGKHPDCKLGFWKTLKIALPHYIRTFIVGGATMGCVAGSKGISSINEKTLIATLVSAEGAHQGYRAMTNDIFGPGTDEFIETARLRERKDMMDGRPPWDEVQTFFLDVPEHIMKPFFFDRTMLDVVIAEYYYNRKFSVNGYATLNDFLKLLHLPTVDGGDEIRHEEIIGEVNRGSHFIDFKNEEITLDDGTKVVSISMTFAPHRLDEET